MKSGPNPTTSTSALSVLAGATLLASLGISIATIALPTLARSFPVTLGELQWVILAYLLAMTVTIVSAGRLGDLYGHRRMLVAGLVLFAIASGLCAISPNLGLLIAARALQGIGGAILVALPMSIARDAVPEARMGAVMGLLGTMSAAGTALGPSLGGVVMANLGWQAAFGLLAFGGALVLALALRALPMTERSGIGAAARMDWTGTLLLTVALGLFSLATTGAGVAVPWGAGMLLLPAALALAIFVRVQMRSLSPLIPLPLLGNRSIAAGLSMNLLLGTVMMSTLVVGSFFLSFALGLDETTTGLVMAVGPVTAALAGAPAGRLADRLGVDRALMLGLAETVLGFVCLALLPRWFGVAGYVGALIVLTPGFQLFLAANNASVMMAASKAERGVLSGLLGLSRNVGLLAGASLMAAIFTALVGTGQIAQASASSIADAFTVSFLISAALTALAMVLAVLRRRRFAPAA
jgi:MFS family permease